MSARPGTRPRRPVWRGLVGKLPRLNVLSAAVATVVQCLITSFAASSSYSGVNSRRCFPMTNILAHKEFTVRGRPERARKDLAEPSRPTHLRDGAFTRDLIVPGAGVPAGLAVR